MASASMSLADTFTPSSWRSRFSRRILIEKGSFATAVALDEGASVQVLHVNRLLVRGRGHAELTAAYKRLGGELVQVSVAHADPVGRFTGWRAAMAVVQWRAEKR